MSGPDFWQIECEAVREWNESSGGPSAAGIAARMAYERGRADERVRCVKIVRHRQNDGASGWFNRDEVSEIGDAIEEGAEKHHGSATDSESRNQPETAQPADTCRETFGSKCCVLPLGHDGHHKSRSGSCWPLIAKRQPMDGPELSDEQLEEMVVNSHPSTSNGIAIRALADEVRRLRAKLGEPKLNLLARAYAADWNAKRLEQELDATRAEVDRLTNEQHSAGLKIRAADYVEMRKERDEARAEAELLRDEEARRNAQLNRALELLRDASKWLSMEPKSDEDVQCWEDIKAFLDQQERGR